ncbi:MAG: hypothetical protein ABJG41_18275 [Cyclobacteriaceae bacterium]
MRITVPCVEVFCGAAGNLGTRAGYPFLLLAANSCCGVFTAIPGAGSGRKFHERQ